MLAIHLFYEEALSLNHLINSAPEALAGPLQHLPLYDAVLLFDGDD